MGARPASVGDVPAVIPRLLPHQPIFQIDKIVGSIAPGNTPPAAEEIVALGYVSEVDWDDDFAETKWVSMMGDSGKVIVATTYDWRLVDYGTNSLAPTMTASLTQPDPGNDLAWFDSTHFLARTDSDEVSVYSASGASITLVGSVVDADYANQVFRVERINAGLVAVAGYSIGLIDVSTPTAPSVLGGLTELDLGGDLVNCMAITADGNNLAYVDQASSSLYMLDISNPAAITFVDTLTLSAQPINMVIVGDRLYAVCLEAEVLVVDISNPAAMAELTPYATGLTDSQAIVAYQTSHLVAGGVEDLHLVDQPPTATFTNATPWPTFSTGSFCNDLSCSEGNRMIASGWSSGSPNEFRLRFFELLTSLGV